MDQMLFNNNVSKSLVFSSYQTAVIWYKRFGQFLTIPWPVPRGCECGAQGCECQQSQHGSAHVHLQLERWNDEWREGGGGGGGGERVREFSRPERPLESIPPFFFFFSLDFRGSESCCAWSRTRRRRKVTWHARWFVSYTEPPGQSSFETVWKSLISTLVAASTSS